MLSVFLYGCLAEGGATIDQTTEPLVLVLRTRSLDFVRCTWVSVWEITFNILAFGA